MDRVPLETLQQIFQFACTDGGYTGGSLALTSRFIREAAQSTRFHSIAVGPETERLTTLVALYQSQCSNATAGRPRTTHLYISTSKPTEDDYDDSEDEEPAPARFVAIRELLHLVTADLQSLVITKDLFAAPRPLFARPLPALRFLTLVRHPDPAALALVPPNSNSNHPDDSASSVAPLFPALTHLHVVAQSAPAPGPASAKHSPFFAGWAAHAPRVTHLRVSAHPRMYALLEELPRALGTPPFRGFRAHTDAGEVGKVGARTYPSLARVVVEPGAPPVRGACGTSRLAYTQRSVQLHWLAAQAREVGVEMCVPAPCHCARTEREWDGAVREGWVRSIGGGDGGEAGGGWFDDEEEDNEDEEDVEKEESKEVGNEGLLPARAPRTA
ncbi:hypothetical protein GSI_03577 [Ganoderma sinense ZZ0214-1]|uniref:Uncharacterized protein n=1 Tax=Ganoderma sinense ZZ0214-1 TaxID=1077348 RepID=A0A2G8SJD6_9APHY|nr:hypothetical protein GSI_03577 [Ganoderma sinense ZZ0214-1]